MQFVNRQVNATAQGIFAHVADDVGHLESEPQLVGVGGGGFIGLTEDAGCDFAHHAGHQVAIALQARPVQVAGLLQIHLAALDHGQQVLYADAVRLDMRHQGLHDRVAGLARKGLLDLLLPPGELGRSHARVGHIVYHVIHFPAKRIEGGNGGPAFRRKEQEGVIKAAARGSGFLLDILLRGHAPILA